MQSFSKKEALRFGWNAFTARPWVFLGATVLMMVVSMVFNKLTEDGGAALTFVIAIAGTLIQWWLYLGFTRMTLTAYAGGPVGFGLLFGESWKTLLQYAIMAIISGILVFVGLVLVIVPGIIIYTMICLAPFLILERELTAIESLKESRRITRGHKMNIFLFVLLLALINIVGALLLGVGLLVSVPVSLLAFVYIFKEMERSVALAPQAVPAPAPQG
ncbi:MAG TPA: hypothetical protein VJ837_00170 [Candidatus Paceibacterota bacterium]|nr:hypothetical protein [Candidatus Paceibacterota bacterium]